ncbi:3-hydroxyisobutyryl-coenzyme A hydrolase [Thelephora ganbajun]|uniref:3-hydroxyisobutyryl-coenzyme A hydrolase n=1 Tax=Thelephora ganbajun TaxID=370292 RepID=A0ACB6ZUW4_THEGA|nr:3-hydroxyisobutyryl-coenzyme A hydrolase [Thelephora ganbajun]
MLARTLRARSLQSSVAAATWRTSQIARHMTPTPSQVSEEAPVLFESNGSVRSYILNRPKKLNALDITMLGLLKPKIQEWNESSLCGLVVGKGVGRAFCAGGDVADVIANAADGKTRHKAVNYFKSEFEVDYMLASIYKPYVAVMDGITMGGGVGLSGMAPFRIATETTVFAMPETKIGYAPDVGANYFLNRLDGELGAYLALTGEALKGRAVFMHGLATHYMPQRRIPALLEALASLEKPTMEMINSTIEQSYYEPEASEPPIALTGSVRVALDSAFSEKSIEKIIESLENYVQSSDEQVKAWATSTLEALDLRSPTSLRVALFALRKNKNGGLIDALRTELDIATALCNGASPDFATGVTAVLSKTPGRPDWQPSTLAEVSEESIIQDFFSPSSKYLDAKPEFNPPAGFDKPKHPMRFALPSQESIRLYVTQDTPGSGGLAVTRDQALQYFEQQTKGKGGVRDKVSEVLDRMCEEEIGDDGKDWLRWKH